MSVDAWVWCDCFERGCLRTPPPYPERVYLDAREGGSIEIDDGGDLQLSFEFDEWRMHRACEHPDTRLVAHFLGNIATIKTIHEELSTQAEAFPVILGQVVKDGVHCGHHLPLDELPQLADEVKRLQDFKAANPENEELLKYFKVQMRELVEAALKVNKPICF